MESHLIEFLKAVVEGQDAGSNWHRWFAEHEQELKLALSPGSFLRLKFHPLTEAQAILRQQGVAFEASERFEWLPSYVVDGKCCFCGATIPPPGRFGRPGCPNRCFPGVMVRPHTASTTSRNVPHAAPF